MNALTGIFPEAGSPEGAYRARRMEHHAFIALDGVSRSFTESGTVRPVLTGLDFSMTRGQFVALLGRSGAGKSTLLNLMGGLDVPTSGTVRIGDTLVNTLDDDARTLFRRNHLGFVFQSFNLIPTLSVRDNVLLPLQLAGTATPQAVQRAVDLLAEVGLGDREESYPDRLSGGEQQRVAIARALVNEPRLLLADEPTGNLDYRTGRLVMDLLHRLVRETATTMLVVTHDRDFLQASDRITVMREGRIADVSYDEAIAQ